MELVRRRPRVLAEIDPHSEWVRGSDFDTLVVDVTGFTKDQLKVLVDPLGSLKVSGERAMDGAVGRRQWCHFLKCFDLPAGCDAATIKVHLDKGMLYVQVPRPDESSEEQYTAAEIHDDVVDGGRWRVAPRQREEHPVRRLARGLSKHRHVVLNVVLAVVLLWLVAFAKDKQPAASGRVVDGNN